MASVSDAKARVEMGRGHNGTATVAPGPASTGCIVWAATGGVRGGLAAQTSSRGAGRGTGKNSGCKRWADRAAAAVLMSQPWSERCVWGLMPANRSPACPDGLAHATRAAASMRVLGRCNSKCKRMVSSLWRGATACTPIPDALRSSNNPPLQPLSVAYTGVCMR
jgi:hypothetical protein